MPGYGLDGPCVGEAVRYRPFRHHGGLARKQGLYGAPCILVLVCNSDVTPVERGEVDRALPGHRRPCNSEVSGEVRLPQLFDAGPESEEP